MFVSRQQLKVWSLCLVWSEVKTLDLYSVHWVASLFRLWIVKASSTHPSSHWPKMNWIHLIGLFLSFVTFHWVKLTEMIQKDIKPYSSIYPIKSFNRSQLTSSGKNQLWLFIRLFIILGRQVIVTQVVCCDVDIVGCYCASVFSEFSTCWCLFNLLKVLMWLYLGNIIDREQA